MASCGCSLSRTAAGLAGRLHDSQASPKPALLLLKGETAWLEDLYMTLCQDPLDVYLILQQKKRLVVDGCNCIRDSLPLGDCKKN